MSLEKRVQRLERMLAVTRELTSVVALGPLLKTICGTAAQLTNSESGAILLRDARTGELHFRAAAGGPADQLVDIPVPVEGSIAGAVLKSGEPITVSDALSDARHYGEVDRRVGRKTRTLVAAPMRIRGGCIGVLEVVNKRGDRVFSEEDVEVLTTLGAQAAVAIENARLVEELREANERLAGLDRLKSDFIAIASHELRTPLSLILIYAPLLQEQLDEETAGPQLDKVHRAALRLKQIIETMLNLRYLETGEVDLSRTLFDLRDEIAVACEDYRPLANPKGLTLDVQTPEEPLLVRADRGKIRVVLDNLLSNAVKFTPSGGRVWVTAAKRRNLAEVAVADNGAGVPQEALKRIFEPFEQVEGHLTREHGGMGLGLSIVKGLVERHGGRVWVEDTPDGGSCFVFILPMEEHSPLDAAQ